MSEQGSHDKILIVDFGSQVTQLIARRVREERVYCEIVPFQKAAEAFAAMKPKAVILSGGPASVLDKDAPLAPKAMFEAGVPVLGICYGEQAMAHQLGGKVEGGHHREFGRAEVVVTEDTPLFEGVWKKGEKYPVWMSHGDRVTRLPQGFRVVGTSPNAPIADDRRREAAVLRHAIPSRGDAHAARRGDPAQLRAQDRAVPRRLDHARLQGRGDREDPQAGRQGPGDLRIVRRRRLGGRGGADPRGDRRPAHLRVRRSRAAAARRRQDRRRRCSAATTTFRWCMWMLRRQFLGALAGVTDPEAKRKTIGKLFIDVFEAEAKKIGGGRVSWRRARSIPT